MSLLAVLCFGAGSARAQQLVHRVPTEAGVTVAVPTSLRAAPGLAALPDTPAQVAGLATFTDDAERPLNVQIRAGAPHGWASLPAAGEATLAEWTRRFAAELQVPEAYDFAPGLYDPERGVLSVRYKVAGPSAARLMQRLPDTHPLWLPTRQAGEDPAIAKCVLDALLAGGASASEPQLGARAPAAARRCGLPDALVAEYVRQLGPVEFAPAVTTVTYLAFFTRSGTIATLIMAPEERQRDVDVVAELITSDTTIADVARLPVASSDTAAWVGKLAGVALGSLLAVFALGGALAWVVVQLGARPRWAVAGSLGTLVALSFVGLLRAGALTSSNGLQLISYALGSALAFRPLVRWLSRDTVPPLLERARRLRRARGLSTVEYIVVLVLIAAVAIASWKLFGGSVQRALSDSTEQLDTLGDGQLGAARGSNSGARGDPQGNGALGSDPLGGGALGGGALGSGAGPDGAGRGSAPRRASPARVESGGATTEQSNGPAGPGPAPSPPASPAVANGAGTSNAPRGGGPPAPGASGAPAGPIESAADGAVQAMQPGRVLDPAAPPTPMPPNAGAVLASEAAEPSTLLRGADVTTDFVPYVSNVKDATIAITGVNPVTNEPVGTFGRVAAGVFAIPGAGNVVKYVAKGGKYVLKGGKAAYEAYGAARAGSKAADAARAAERAAEEELARRAATNTAEEAAERGGARAGEPPTGGGAPPRQGSDGGGTGSAAQGPPQPSGAPGGALARVPNFANGKLAAEHYAKHAKGVIVKPKGKLQAKPGGPDVPEYKSLDEYVSAARQFHSGPPGPGVLEGMRKNGDYVRYDPSTGLFGVRSQDGTIRTFFRPDGDAAARMKYFQDQFK